MVKDRKDLHPHDETHHTEMGIALMEETLMFSADTDLALLALQEALTRLLSVYAASLFGAAIFLVLGSHLFASIVPIPRSIQPAGSNHAIFEGSLSKESDRRFWPLRNFIIKHDVGSYDVKFLGTFGGGIDGEISPSTLRVITFTSDVFFQLSVDRMVFCRL